MKSNTIILATVISVLCGFACGDDEGDDTTKENASDAGPRAGGNASGGKGGSQSTGNAGSGVTAGNTSVGPGAAVSAECGSKTCTSPGGSFAAACCVDAATETCGMSFMGAGCSVPEPGDERCPDVMGFVTLPSCCTEDGMCGINASMFGMPGCIELSEAATRAQMSSASSFPEASRCDGSSVGTDSDAGTSEADGGT